MKHIAAMILAVPILIGCGTSPNQVGGEITSGEILSGEIISGVILPTSTGDYIPYSTDGQPSGGWQPSEEMILAAEEAIIQYIRDSNEEIFGKLDNYRCQYFGIIVNGRKRIYCNFFWLTEFWEDWKTKPVVVDDGGDRYFQLEYDVETGECLNFAVNGEA